MQDNTNGTEKIFYMVEARYHYAAKFTTIAEASTHCSGLNKTSKDRYGNDAYKVVPYTRH